MIPRHVTDPAEAPAILALLHAAFASMHARIDPPSSLHSLTPTALFASGEVWIITAHPNTRPIACVILTPRAGVLYVGKLAVAADQRGRGLARRMIALAEARAVQHGLGALELQVRVELTENHAAFQALGFFKVAETSHAGYLQPTSFTYRKKVPLHG